MGEIESPKKFYVHRVTGAVKSESELHLLATRKIDRNRNRLDLANYFEPFEGLKMTRPTRRLLERRQFKAKYGKVKW